MKKYLHFTFVFLVLLMASCATDKLEVQENQTTNLENVWAYDGDNTTIKGVIKELREGSNRISLERRLLKNEVLWEEAEFIFIDGKKRILVPFLSIDKENVLGVLSLAKNEEGKTTFNMTVRRDLTNKNPQFPFWKRGIWSGYFMALDKDILGIKNGNPGLVKKKVTKNSQTMRTVCKDVVYAEVCIYDIECANYGSGGETYNNCISTLSYCYDLYTPYCYEVEDPTDPTEPSDPPIDECANSENLFDSSSGQTMSEEISTDVTYPNSLSRNVKYKRQIYTGYGMQLYSLDHGVQNKVNNNWEWTSITHDTVYQEVDNSLFVITHTVNTISAIVNNPNTATITINYNVKAVLECGGVILKTKETNHNSISVKSPYINGD